MGARSNGCISCKSRRVKCDERPIACQRCEKAGIVCKGYSAAKWIDEKPRIQKSLSITQSQEKHHSTARQSGFKLYHAGQLSWDQKYHSPQQISCGIPLTGFKDSIILSFLEFKLSQSEGRRCDSLDVKGTWIGWASDDSKTTLHALAAIVFGHVHHCASIVEDGKRSYYKAISEIRIKLLDSGNLKRFDTMASVTALCMYELADRRSDVAWRYHADGLSNLIESSDPSLFQKYPYKSIFLEQRALIVCKAMFAGHSTFLSQPIWKTVPWEHNLLSKGPLDFLFDILCDIATYLEELRAPSDWKQQAHTFDLKRRVTASIEELNAWWQYWMPTKPLPCQEIPIDTETTLYTKDANGVIFPSILVYDELRTGYTVCTYNAARILLLEALEVLSQTPSHLKSHEYLSELNNDNNSQGPLLGISSDISGLAKEIFRSAEYLHTKSDMFMVSFTSMFIFDIAYSALDPNSREAKWLLSKLALPMRSMHGKGERAKAITVLPTCRLLQPVY